MILENNIRHKEVRRVLVNVLLLNFLVAFAKIFFGIFSSCASITADGFHSLSDGTSNILGIIGINIAYRPVDSDHPYGHKKYETFFSLGIAVLLLIICINLLREGASRIQNPVVPQVDARSFAVMIITLAINFTVMRYEYRKGVKLQSDILKSDSMHTKADIFTSSAVIITLVVIRLGYPILDPIATMLIALFIGRAAFDIFRDSSKVLCDQATIIETRRISEIVMRVAGVKSCHKIRTRGREDDIYIDLHVQVDGNMHMNKAHQISYTIEEELKKGIPGVSDVIVHMEPGEKNR